MAARVLDERPKLVTNEVRVLDKLSAGDSDEPSAGVLDKLSPYFGQTAARAVDKRWPEFQTNISQMFLWTAGVPFECWSKFWMNGSRCFGWTTAGNFRRTRPEFQMNGFRIFGQTVVGVSDKVDTGSTVYIPLFCCIDLGSIHCLFYWQLLE